MEVRVNKGKWLCLARGRGDQSRSPMRRQNFDAWACRVFLQEIGWADSCPVSDLSSGGTRSITNFHGLTLETGVTRGTSGHKISTSGIQ